MQRSSQFAAQGSGCKAIIQKLELDSLPNTTIAAIEPNLKVNIMSRTSQGSAEYGLPLPWCSDGAASLHDLLRLGNGSHRLLPNGGLSMHLSR